MIGSKKQRLDQLLNRLKVEKQTSIDELAADLRVVSITERSLLSDNSQTQSSASSFANGPVSQAPAVAKPAQISVQIARIIRIIICLMRSSSKWPQTE